MLTSDHFQYISSINRGMPHSLRTLDFQIKIFAQLRSHLQVLTCINIKLHCTYLLQDIISGKSTNRSTSAIASQTIYHAPSHADIFQILFFPFSQQKNFDNIKQIVRFSYRIDIHMKYFKSTLNEDLINVLLTILHHEQMGTILSISVIQICALLS